MGLEEKVRQLREATGGSRTTGWMHDPVCWLLFGLIRFCRPSLVIQTGHLWGKSALVACEALENQSLEDDQRGDAPYSYFVSKNSPRVVRKPRMISVDPSPMGVPHPDAGVSLLDEWYPYFEFARSGSAEFFENFTPNKRERIFGIVDGDHTRKGAQADLQALASLGAEVIVLDDTSWIPTLAKLGRELGGYTATEFPEYNGVTLLTRDR